MRICGVDICKPVDGYYRRSCKNCPHYADADGMIRCLLDALEEEHTGLRDIFKQKLKEEFGYEKEGILNDGDQEGLE